MNELREKLANLCHEQWSGWMQYLFSKCEKNIDGTVTMPQWAVERWVRQMQTPYPDLSETERDSDRAEADKFLGLCGTENAALRAEVERLKAAIREASEYLCSRCMALGTMDEELKAHCGVCRPLNCVAAAEILRKAVGE